MVKEFKTLKAGATAKTIKILVDVVKLEATGNLEKSISDYTAKKVVKFIVENGYPIFVNKWFLDMGNLPIVFDGTRDKNGNFRAGYKVYRCGKRFYVKYLTNWQGQRDELYIIEDLKDVSNVLLDNITANLKPIWTSAKIS